MTEQSKSEKSLEELYREETEDSPRYPSGLYYTDAFVDWLKQEVTDFRDALHAAEEELGKVRQSLRDADEVITLMAEVAELETLSFGEHETMTDHAKQEITYHCYGCDGIGYSRWPEWKLEFEHRPNCKSELLKRVVLSSQQRLKEGK